MPRLSRLSSFRLAWCAALVLFATSASQAGPPLRWAHLVGVNDYIQAQGLKYGVADQSSLHDALLRTGFPEDNAVLLVDSADDQKYRPIKANIETELDRLLCLVARDDIVVVTISGLGVCVEGKNDSCPTDGTIDNPATLVSQDQVYEKPKACRAAFKRVLVDACRKDMWLHSRKSLDDVKSNNRQFVEALERVPQSVVLLNNCTCVEISYEDEELAHGAFMHFVLEAISGKGDADANQRLSVVRLASYAVEQTRTHVARKVGESQRPFLREDLPTEPPDFSIVHFESHPRTPAPGKTGRIITNSLDMKLVTIPAGEFLMGSDETAAQLRKAGFTDPQHIQVSDERPRHRIRITRPFLVGVCEVTKGQFGRFVESTGYKTDAERNEKGGWGYNAKTKFCEQSPEFNWRNTGWTQSNEHPVVNVSHRDAVAFCEWLSKKEGGAYRLPTEAEWEYTARAGVRTRFSVGDAPSSLAGAANVRDQSFERAFPKADLDPSFAFDDGWPFTAPVGRFAANGFGLYDTIGNVSEWCSDWYGGIYYRGSPAEDPQGPDSGLFRLLRGGSWHHRPVDCRAAQRGFSNPSFLSLDVGFRVVRAP